MRDSSVAAWAMSAKSWTSWTEFEASIAQPVGPHGHHVAVVAEDRQRMGGDRAGGDVEDRRA